METEAIHEHFEKKKVFDLKREESETLNAKRSEAVILDRRTLKIFGLECKINSMHYETENCDTNTVITLFPYITNGPMEWH